MNDVYTVATSHHESQPAQPHTWNTGPAVLATAAGIGTRGHAAAAAAFAVKVVLLLLLLLLLLEHPLLHS